MKTKDLKLYDKVVFKSSYGSRTVTTFVVFIDQDEEIIHVRNYELFEWEKESYTFEEFEGRSPIKIGKAILPLMSIPFVWSVPLFFILWAILHYVLPASIISIAVFGILTYFRAGLKLPKNI